MPFQDRVAYVTGAGSGMGRAVALDLAAQGCRLALFDINEGGLKETADQISQGAIWRAGDVRSLHDLQALAGEAVERWGAIHILVNAAGVAVFGVLPEMTEGDWDFVVDVNLKGTFLATKACLESMVANGYGRIVNFGSVEGFVGTSLMSAYCATKSGVIGFTRGLAAQVAEHGVTVNAICPGVTVTGMSEPSLEDEDISAKLLDDIPMRRFAIAEMQAKVVRFLASDDAEYITAQTLVSDGGMIATHSFY